MKKTAALIAILIVISLALAACVKSGGSSSSPWVSTSTGSMSGTSASSEPPEPPEPVWDPATDPEYKLMDGAALGLPFAFYMPVTFTAWPVSTPGFLLIAMGTDGDSGKLPELMITRGNAEPELLSYTAQAFEARMHESGAEDYICLGVEPVEIGGTEGLKILGQTLRGEHEVLHDKYLVNHEDSIYILHYTASAEDVGDDRADKLVSTFAFVELPPAPPVTSSAPPASSSAAPDTSSASSSSAS